MSRRSNWRKAARRPRTRNHSTHSSFGRSLYRRRLRLEPLEDRRLLAVVTVTTLADTVDFNDGVTSLREAIFAANTVPGADTIRFDPALTAGGPATILLTHGELAITDSLTIDGPGADLLAIDASGNDPTPDQDNGDGSRVFFVSDGVFGAAIDVTIGRISVTGSDRNEHGAAIGVQDDNLRLESVSIFGNHGGGVDQDRGSLTIIGSAIHNNWSNDVGGVRVVRANLTIDSSTFEGNESGNGGGGGGGGVYYRDRLTPFAVDLGLEVHIRDSRFIGNTAALGGGGATIGSGGIVIVENNRFEDNSAGLGGGLYLATSASTIRNNSISANTSHRGGGVYLFGSTQLNVFANNEIVGNEAVDYGGGVYVDSDDPLTILSNTIRENHAGRQGGGIYFDFAFAPADLMLRVESTTIIGNVADREGGGIYANASLWVGSSIISDNVAQNGEGGGIYTRNALAVFGSLFSGNAAHGTTGGGGAIAFVYAGKMAIDRSQFSDNTADTNGGGVLSLNVNNRSVVSVSNSTFNGNSAGRNGGALSISVFDWQVTNSTVSGNSAGALGGGIWAGAGGEIAYSTLTANSALAAGGGAFISSGLLDVRDSIVALNANSSAPDLTGLMTATIVTTHSLIGSSSGTLLVPAPVGAPDANGNLIGGVTFNSRINPQLGPLADNGEFELPGGSHILTHALLPGSPAINAGDPAAVAGVDGVPVHDQRGAPFTRVYGGRIDIGAMESIPAGVLPGDYNGDGAVNSADYSVWRNTMGSAVSAGVGADGNGDGMVDALDYAVWRSNFGAMVADVTPMLGGDAGAAVLAVQVEPPAEPGAAGGGAMAMRFGDSAIQPPALPGVFQRGRHRATVDAATRQDRLLEAWAATRTLHGHRDTRADSGELSQVEPLAHSEHAGAEVEALDWALAELDEIRLAVRE